MASPAAGAPPPRARTVPIAPGEARAGDGTMLSRFLAGREVEARAAAVGIGGGMLSRARSQSNRAGSARYSFEGTKLAAAGAGSAPSTASRGRGRGRGRARGRGRGRSRGGLRAPPQVPPPDSTALADLGQGIDMAGHGDGALHLVALCENRSREIGVAVMDLRNMTEAKLCQVTDSQSYASTMALLERYDPIEIILSKSLEGRVLFDRVQAAWGAGGLSKVAVVARKYYDDTRGLIKLTELAADGVGRDASSRYLALASAGALLSFVEHIQNISLARGSLRVSWEEASGHMSIDLDSVRGLEVLVNSRTTTDKATLFQAINHTKTTVGRRLLRVNLLSPHNDTTTLEARLDCVEELLTNQAAFFTVTEGLAKLVDLDLLLTNVALQPRVSTPRSARRTIQAVIDLKQTIDALPGIATALDTCGSHLLSVLAVNFRNPQLQEMAELINHVIMPDTTRSKSAALMRQQECFAVRKGIDGDLDAVRTVYMDAISDLYDLTEQYKVDWMCPRLELRYNSTRGYHLVLPKGFAPPPMCIQVVKNRSSTACCTEDLASLNSRCKESLDNVYCITHMILEEVLTELRSRMSALFTLADSVALLDLVGSFTSLVRHSPNEFARPTLVPLDAPQADRVLAVEQGRHPVVEFVFSSKPFVPNDIRMAPDGSLLLLTGANNSGKSTYLQQVALLVILAHLGCYLPCKAAVVPMVDHLFTRMGSGDDMEANVSSFLMEMQEMAAIVKRATPLSLVLVDELGRSTSNEDGLGIAWAVCEHFLGLGCFTVFVTHYHQLAKLGNLYPAAVNLSTTATADLETGVVFSYKVGAGALADTSAYGIALAKACGMPAEVIAMADSIRRHLDSGGDGDGAPGGVGGDGVPVTPPKAPRAGAR